VSRMTTNVLQVPIIFPINYERRRRNRMD
jgi:hypothetical protein